MNEKKHSPEPWILKEDDLRDGEDRKSYEAIRCTLELGEDESESTDNTPVLSCDGCGVVTKANAERIVACVNALAGVEDPEKFVAAVGQLIKAARPFVRGGWEGGGPPRPGITYQDFECLVSTIQKFDKERRP